MYDCTKTLPKRLWHYFYPFFLPKWQVFFASLIFKIDFFYFVCTSAKKAVLLWVVLIRKIYNFRVQKGYKE